MICARYGNYINRQNEETFSHCMYNWQYFDKRNRLCHNMIMEHFEMHKEQFEDLVVDVKKKGPQVLMDLPEKEFNPVVSTNDFALIDEISGYTNFVENFLRTSNLPETSKQRIRARMFTYNSPKPKEIAVNEIRATIFGN